MSHRGVTRVSCVRLVTAAALAASAVGLAVGCSLSLDGYSGGNPDASLASDASATDAPTDATAQPQDAANLDAVAPDAAPAAVLVVDAPLIIAAGSFDLTKLGSLDWAQWTYGGFLRCASCTSRIGVLTATSVLHPYTDDARVFTWTNGLPAATGTTTDGIYIENVGSQLALSVAATPIRAALTLQLDTFHDGASFVARIDGAPVAPQTRVVAAANGTTTFSITVHFAAPAGATLQVGFAVTGDLLAGSDAGYVGNIAAIAATLAPDP